MNNNPNAHDQEPTIDWNKPATDEAVAKLVKVLKLPQEHLSFFKRSDGVTASLAVQPYIAQIWSIEALLTNALFYDALLQELMEMPYMLAFGDNLSSQVFLYDRREQPWKIVCCPGTSLGPEYVMSVAADFSSLLEMLGKEAPTDSTAEAELEERWHLELTDLDRSRWDYGL